jgi:hypothetical protein
MAILGGSPLGLVGVQSTAHNSSPKGRSTFNGGGSRNVNVSSYNNSKNNVYYANDSGNSLFTGKRVVNPWPEIPYLDDGFYDTTGAGSDGKNYKKSSTTNTEYDTSVLNIVEKLANTKAALKPQDFAYCKNLGVYPNNRLVVVRRFLGPAEDNIFTKSQGGEVGALALVISWIKEDEDFLNIDFGEEWVDAEASFTGIINSLGEDFGRSGKMGLGEMVGQGMGGTTLPGFTEVMTREILSKMGIMDKDSANLPVGNPNLIKQAKARKTIDYDQAGSGLNTKVSFKVTAEYELKFISGLDPTLIWMDLIGNFTRFGTSKSDTFGLSKNFSQKMKQWINNPSLLVKHLSKTLQGAITKAIDEFSKTLNDTPSEKKADDSESPEEAAKNRVKAFLTGLKAKLGKLLQKVLQKYKIKAIGIINALSGLPSTPWHITIGNPMRPIFASGDMYMDNVTLKLGSQLSFNNLPTNLTLEFNLTNARPWGMQEIMGKFSSGYLRTVNFTSKMPLSYNEINDTSVSVTRADGGTQSTINTTTDTTVNTNTDGGNTTSNETPGSVSTDGTPAVIDNSTVKVENNRVPLKGKKDEKGNLKFEKNEKLVLTDKDKSGNTFKTYTYIKNADGSYTSYVTEKDTGKYDKVKSKVGTNDPVYKTTTKVIEPGSDDAKKLDVMFNKDGTVNADKQKSLKGDSNNGIKGVKSENLPISKEQKKVQTEALLNAANKTNSTPVSMAANPNLVPFPSK